MHHMGGSSFSLFWYPSALLEVVLKGTEGTPTNFEGPHVETIQGQFCWEGEMFGTITHLSLVVPDDDS